MIKLTIVAKPIQNRQINKSLNPFGAFVKFIISKIGKIKGRGR